MHADFARPTTLNAGASNQESLFNEGNQRFLSDLRSMPSLSKVYSLTIVRRVPKSASRCLCGRTSL